MEPAQGSAIPNFEVTALIERLKEILSAPDPAAPATRQHLKETADRLSRALETPGGTVQRVAYYVSSHSDSTRL